jgi:hypothetical protein
MTSPKKNNNRAFEIWEAFFDYTTLIGGVVLILMGVIGIVFPSQIIREHIELRLLMCPLVMLTGTGMAWHSLRMRPTVLHRFRPGELGTSEGPPASGKQLTAVFNPLPNSAKYFNSRQGSRRCSGRCTARSKAWP